jgi:hypothetical protein
MRWSEHAVRSVPLAGYRQKRGASKKSVSLVELAGIFLNSVVLGIEHCNYCPSTRNVLKRFLINSMLSSDGLLKIAL